MPRVLNKHKDAIPKDAVYIGRPSKWGNPFIIGPDGDRTDVIEQYYAYIMDTPKLYDAAKKELRGKDLVCFCAPRACHGDVLLLIANDE